MSTKFSHKSDFFVLDSNTAHNLQFLQKERFTHIVNCAASLPSMHQDFFQYCRIDLDDTTNQTLISAVEKFIQFIERPPQTICRSQVQDPFTAPPALSTYHSFQTPLKTPSGYQKKILVHCKQGKSRAPTVVCGYLMWKLRLTFKQALEMVQKKRPKVDPNFGFLMEGSKNFEQYFFPKGPHKLLIKKAPQDLCNMDEQQENLDENASVEKNMTKYQSHNFLMDIKLGANPHSPDYQSPFCRNLVGVNKGFSVQKVFQIKRQTKPS